MFNLNFLGKDNQCIEMGWLQIQWASDISTDSVDKIVEIVNNLDNEHYRSENSDSEKYEMVDWYRRYMDPSIIEFDTDRIIYKINEDTLLVVYKNKKQRDDDIIKHKENNVNFSDLQSPKIWWYIDYKDKYILIIRAKKPLEGPTDNRVYKGLIINPNIQAPIRKDIYTEQIRDILEEKWDTIRL